MSGTVGQADAGELSGGNFSVIGGFWGVVAVIQTEGGPLLSVVRPSGTGAVTIKWTLPDDGWVLPLAPVVHGQNSLFTYQGHLRQNDQIASGLFDFEVQLFDGPAPGGANLTGVFPYNAVQVDEGLFMLDLDFGAGVFEGPQRYLEIKVRPNGGGVFTKLSPRQRLSAAPNAIYAQKAGGLQAGINSTIFGTVTFDPLSGPPFQVDGTTKVPNLNADLLDGFDSSAFVKRAGDSMIGKLTVNGPGGLATFSEPGSFFGNDVAVAGTADSGLGIGVIGSSSGDLGAGVVGNGTGDGGTGVYGSVLASAGADGKAIHVASFHYAASTDSSAASKSSTSTTPTSMSCPTTRPPARTLSRTA